LKYPPNVEEEGRFQRENCLIVTNMGPKIGKPKSSTMSTKILHNLHQNV